MLYQGYMSYVDASEPIRDFARRSVRRLKPGSQSPPSRYLRRLIAVSEMLALAGLTHERPPFGFESIAVNGRDVEVHEEIAMQTPFCSLVHFRKGVDLVQPRVLLVAPLSGHFATLLRGTARTLLADHDVYITDWHNVRDVPLAAGVFDLDAFVDHVISFLERIGRQAHVVAVCQPTVGVLSAVSVMAADNNPAQPSSMTLMAGPIDTRVNPTQVNELAKAHSMTWFERNLIGVVPARYPGAARRVYPGFVQIASFMSMNPERHKKAFEDLFGYLVEGDMEKAEPILTFYHEYFATMDLPAEFYLQTIRDVFQEHLLPRGKLLWHGNVVEPAAIKRTALFTVEGEKDDICAIGQTLAAQELCSGIRPYLKQHHVQTGAGHYGVFNGRRWEGSIYPRLRELIHMSA